MDKYGQIKELSQLTTAIGGKNSKFLFSNFLFFMVWADSRAQKMARKKNRAGYNPFFGL